jgi:hypothetical protein
MSQSNKILKDFEKLAKNSKSITFIEVKLKNRPIKKITKKKPKQLSANQLANALAGAKISRHASITPNQLANAMAGAKVSTHNNWLAKYPILNFPPAMNPMRSRSPPPNRNNWSRNSTPRRYESLFEVYPNIGK